MEIERKFLVNNPPDNLEDCEKIEISQAYVSTVPTIRVRQSGEEFFLTVKSQPQAGKYGVEEFEMELSHTEYETLLAKTEDTILTKTRYKIPLCGRLTAELDIYHGPLNGLLTVEVEFDTEEEAQSFEPPPWFGEEISFDYRYRNSQLSKNGIPGKS